MVLDLDETLVSGPGHRRSAALAGIRALTRNGLEIRNPELTRLFGAWSHRGNGEEQRLALSEEAKREVTPSEAFLFDFLTRQFYDKDPNDLKHYDKLVASAMPGLSFFKRRKLVRAAVQAYHGQRDENARKEVLAALPNAPELLDWALENKINVALASKGFKDRQTWKFEHLLLPKMRSPNGGSIPIYTTDRRIFKWGLNPADKNSKFFRKVLSRMKVRKGDFTIHVGDRHDADVVEPRAARFDFIVHVPGRRDQDYLTGKKESKADVVAGNLSEAMERISEKVKEFRGEPQ